jgi:SnoaL-like domain
MSHLGAWKPANLEERTDRLESLASIRQLASRYAVALDSRNMDDLVALFVPDVQVGREGHGRAALKQWFTDLMRGPRTTVHFVGNHVVDFADADHATGIVYCHDELERPTTGAWEYGKLQYWDSYVRLEGEWFFQRRQFHRWYIVDALERPSPGAGTGADIDPLTTHLVPDAFPSWAAFWDSAG